MAMINKGGSSILEWVNAKKPALQAEYKRLGQCENALRTPTTPSKVHEFKEHVLMHLLHAADLESIAPGRRCRSV